MKRIFILVLAAALSVCCTESPRNTNGIWLWSKYMNEVDLQELADKGIGNIILHEKSFEAHGVDSTMAFINAAEEKGILTHVWFQCFYKEGKWISPVDDDNVCYKQDYYDEVITRAEHYLDLGVKAIHLDYIRFGGTAYKHDFLEQGITGTGAVTEFCRQISERLKAKNPDVILSAALMPEPDSEYYYGQDPSQMGRYIDILMPMIYRHSPSYSKGGPDSARVEWARKVAEHFVAKGAPATVWAGTTTYRGDDGEVTAMDAEGIRSDCEDFTGTGVEGVVLFRYGIGEIPDMNGVLEFPER